LEGGGSVRQQTSGLNYVSWRRLIVWSAYTIRKHNSRKLVLYSGKRSSQTYPPCNHLPLNSDTYLCVCNIIVTVSQAGIYWNTRPSLRQPPSQLRAPRPRLMLFDEPRELLTHCYRPSIRPPEGAQYVHDVLCTQNIFIHNTAQTHTHTHTHTWPACYRIRVWCYIICIDVYMIIIIIITEAPPVIITIIIYIRIIYCVSLVWTCRVLRGYIRPK